MQTSTVDLRPLDYGGILDRTIELYREHFVTFLKIAAVVAVPTGIVQMLTGGMGGEAEMLGLRAAGAIGLLSIVSGIAHFVATGAMTYAVTEIYLGREASAGDAYRFINRQFGAYFGTMLLMGLFCGLGILACGVGLFILTLYCAFTGQVFIAEGTRYVAAIKRSMQLVSGQFWRVFVVYLLISIFTSIVVQMPLAVINGAAQALPSLPLHVLQGLWAAVGTTIAMPLTTATMIILYFDIRVRKEGFDLEMMAEQMQARRLAGTPSPPYFDGSGAGTPAEPSTQTGTLPPGDATSGDSSVSDPLSGADEGSAGSDAGASTEP